jgi:hypothetical protein
MLATSLVIGSFLTVLFFILGIVTWLGRQRIYDDSSGRSKTDCLSSRVLMNKDGELIEEEIVSVRFEPGYFDDDEEEEEEEEN